MFCSLGDDETKSYWSDAVSLCIEGKRKQIMKGTTSMKSIIGVVYPQCAFENWNPNFHTIALPARFNGCSPYDHPEGHLAESKVP